MKTRFLFLLLLVATYGFSQSVNNYKGVIIPLRYNFQNDDNQFRLQTMSKTNLKKAGFEAFYANEIIPADLNDRCGLLYIDLVKEGNMFVTKLKVVFKDCFGTVLFQSELGKSREKEYEASYQEALNGAFESVNKLNYKYNGNTNFMPKTVPFNKVETIATTATVVVPAVAVSLEPKTEATSDSSSLGTLYAQPTSYGYQLIDSEPKVVMKVYKTSSTTSYMATKGSLQGALVAKDKQWFFEYYQNDTLISEKLDVKF